jgi:riboflavin kinase / FMN adenylyltransferase
MKMYRGIESWNCGDMGRTVASLGNYDGVHLGHQAILRRVTTAAKDMTLPSVVLTFDPIPRKVLNPESAPRLIQTLPQRLRSLDDLNIDHTIIIVFDLKFSKKKPREFVTEFLVKCLRIRRFVVGENFSFGHQKSGNIALLQEMGRQHDFDVEEVPQVQLDGKRVSSTRIRDLVTKGSVEEANRYLGHAFRLTGKVVAGEKLGGTIGIPTANLAVENELIPGSSVYVCKAIIGSESFPAVANIGVRPTVGGKKLTVEAHLLDFSRNLYGQDMELEFFRKLRPEMRFDGIEQLKTQIHRDIQKAREYFSFSDFG